MVAVLKTGTGACRSIPAWGAGGCRCDSDVPDLKADNSLKEAAKILPEGWNISIDIERGSAVVSIWDNDGEPIDNSEYEDIDLTQEIKNAVAYAVQYENDHKLADKRRSRQRY